MDNENTGAERPLSAIDAAVTALRQSREDQATTEQATEESEEQTEELKDADEIQDEETVNDEGRASEQSEEETDEEADPEEAEGDLYEIGDLQFTLSELEDWKASGLRQKDYTQKTQQLAADREQLVQDRDAWQSERQKVEEALTQRQAELQDALATFAIEQVQKPKRSDFTSTDDYLAAQEAYDDQVTRKAKAQETYQALAAQQKQQRQAQEATRAMQYFPDWNTQEGFDAALNDMTSVVQDYGISRQEIIEAGLSDHRMFRVLNELASLRKLVGERNAKRTAAAKKVTKATKRLAPGTKQTETGGEVKIREARKALRKSGSAQDAVALLRAKRKG